VSKQQAHTFVQMVAGSDGVLMIGTQQGFSQLKRGLPCRQRFMMHAWRHSSRTTQLC
jgi:hypothetical protein